MGSLHRFSALAFAATAVTIVASPAFAQSSARAQLTPLVTNAGPMIVPGGFAGPAAIAVTNTGDSTLSAFFIFGDSRTLWEVACLMGDGTYQNIVSPGASCIYRPLVPADDIDPTGQLGPGSGTIHYLYFDVRDYANSPDPGNLTGVPTTSVAIPVTWIGISEPVSFDDPSPLDFGTRALGTTSPTVTRTIRNNSPYPWTITLGIFPGPQPNCGPKSAKFIIHPPTVCETLADEAGGSFSTSLQGCDPIPPLGTCTLSVAFSPRSARTLAIDIAIGVSAQSGTPVRLAATGQGMALRRALGTVLAIEYYNATRNRYFLTDLAAEESLLDSGAIPGWQRTGYSFWVFPASASLPAGTSPVCRFYGKPQAGLDSHFYSAAADECAALRARPDAWIEESPALFYAYLPDATGACPPNSSPIYRFFDGKPDSDHRYLMYFVGIAAPGWIAEGYGTPPVSMCVPQ